MAVLRGRHFFMNPGPTNIPERILRAINRSAMDFIQPDFKAIVEECVAGLRYVFKTEQSIVIYNSSGHGAWEAALVNILSPGDRVLVLESGYFSLNWAAMAERHGIEVDMLPFDWRSGVDPAAVEAKLKKDTARDIRAVLVVHNETSTGVANQIGEVRKAMDRAGHPAMLLADTISSLVSFDFRMDDWGVDVAVGGSQKGLMLPAGMSFTAVSRKALQATQSARCARSYWDWRLMLADGKQTNYSGTAGVHLFYGLQESLRMIQEEGLDAIFARHHRLAEATRCAVRAWSENGGPQLYPTRKEVESDSLTAVLMPEGHDCEAVRRVCLNRFNVSLGGGLGRLGGRLFRIGHLGDLNEPMVLGTLGTIEMALDIAKVPHGKGGVDAAMAYLAGAA